MKAWEVIAIAVDGELVCSECAQGFDERRAFVEEVPDMAPLFASDANGEETCGRCGEKLREG